MTSDFENRLYTVIHGLDGISDKLLAKVSDLCRFRERKKLAQALVLFRFFPMRFYKHDLANACAFFRYEVNIPLSTFFPFPSNGLKLQDY